MVRRGSTVRVRQRALQKPRKRGFLIQIDLRLIARAVVWSTLWSSQTCNGLDGCVERGENGLLQFSKWAIVGLGG
jgi:hypothetical protein